MLFIFGSSSRVDIVIKRLTGKNNSCSAKSFKQKESCRGKSNTKPTVSTLRFISFCVVLFFIYVYYNYFAYFFVVIVLFWFEIPLVFP